MAAGYRYVVRGCNGTGRYARCSETAAMFPFPTVRAVRKEADKAARQKGKEGYASITLIIAEHDETGTMIATEIWLTRPLG